MGDAYELSFKNASPTGKRYFLALDVSGSMSWDSGVGNLTAAQIAAAIALVINRLEHYL